MGVNVTVMGALPSSPGTAEPSASRVAPSGQGAWEMVSFTRPGPSSDAARPLFGTIATGFDPVFDRPAAATRIDHQGRDLDGRQAGEQGGIRHQRLEIDQDLRRLGADGDEAQVLDGGGVVELRCAAETGQGGASRSVRGSEPPAPPIRNALARPGRARWAGRARGRSPGTGSRTASPRGSRRCRRSGRRGRGTVATIRR